MSYVDFHCDTLKRAFEQEKREIGSFPEVSVDLERLHLGGARAQFFAAFVPPRENNMDWWQKYGEKDPAGQLREDYEPEDAYIRALREILIHTAEVFPDMLQPVQTAREMREAWDRGQIAAFFTLEDGRSVGGSLEKLKSYRDFGVSLITLTWNGANCFGFPNSRDAKIMEQGLTAFGQEAVEYMNELGILVDVSHLSDGGFWDVVRITKKPFVASHSNCRALSPHPRNLTDEMIRALAEKGGVAGLNFCSAFLGMDTMSWDSKIADMVAQVSHMVQVGGLECAAIGTDFDGIESRLEITGPDQMERLWDALKKAGFSQDAVEKIAWENGVRVLEEVLR